MLSVEGDHVVWSFKHNPKINISSSLQYFTKDAIILFSPANHGSESFNILYLFYFNIKITNQWNLSIVKDKNVDRAHVV